jgi:translation initiation factor 2 subunit 2
MTTEVETSLDDIGLVVRNTIPECDDVDDLLNMNLSKKKKKKKLIEETMHVDESEKDHTYVDLLARIFSKLKANNIVHEKHKLKLQPPQLCKVGTKKTGWYNFMQICESMRRSYEHVLMFVTTEFCTEGNLNEKKHLVLKGKYIENHIVGVLKKYITEYIICKNCNGNETLLSRDSITRLNFITCEACGAVRSVGQIKSGFHATTRADRKK